MTTKNSGQGSGVRDQKEPGQVRMIPLDLLDENPLNPRRSMDEAGLQELAASIKASGITCPLTVRPLDIEGLVEERYEIVCGHRRVQAATIAELEAVPCIVRAMTDQEAAEIALVDNLQRVDVSALDQAEAYKRLLDRLGSIEAVAARVGKEVSHVARMLKLCSLGIRQRDALREKLITIDHALLLAKLGTAEQDAALKWCLDTQAGSKKPVDQVIAASVKYLNDDRRYRQWEPESVVRLREHIEQSVGRKLSRAPWGLADGALSETAGSCVDCPSNTKANTALFSDLDMEEATCADGKCFEGKRETFVHIKLAAAGSPVVKLSWKRTSTPPRMDEEKTPKLTQVFKAGQWVEAKKGSCGNIVAGVTVDWSDDGNRGYGGGGGKLRKPGEVLRVCVAAKCKAHRKEWEEPKDRGQGSGVRDPKAEAEREEKMRVAALAETKLRVRLAGEAIEKVKKLPEQLLRRILIDQLPHNKVFEAILPGFEKAVRTAALDSVEFARAVALLNLGVNEVEVWGRCEASTHRKEFISTLKLIGYDCSKAWDVKGSEPASQRVSKAAKKAVKKGVKR